MSEDDGFHETVKHLVAEFASADQHRDNCVARGNDFGAELGPHAAVEDREYPQDQLLRLLCLDLSPACARALQDAEYGFQCNAGPEGDHLGRLVAGLYHFGRISLQRIEESRRVDGGIHDGPTRGVGRRLNVWVKEPEGWRRLARENREEREKLRRAVVGQVRQCEAFGVVLVYSELPLVFPLTEWCVLRPLKSEAATGSPAYRDVRTGTA
jgi:hypothetical protein